MGSEVCQLKLPVLDFTNIEDMKQGSTNWVKASHEVRRAFEDYGCFMVTCNKVPLELHNSLFAESLKGLFDVPTETKMKNKNKNPLLGYVGQIPKLPLHESTGIDDVASIVGVQDFTKLMWPDGNETFCKNVHEYAKLVAELDQMVTRMIFESYGVEKYWDAYIDSTAYLLRLIKNRAPTENESSLGFVSHTDKNFTTILHQNQINGLEVEMKNGDTVFVDMSSSSSFVVMAGDALMLLLCVEAWSNDRIVSPKHWVIMKAKVDRYSMGLFSFSNGIIKAPEELVDDDHPLKYKPFDYNGLLNFFATDEGRYSKSPIKAYCGIY